MLQLRSLVILFLATRMVDAGVGSEWRDIDPDLHTAWIDYMTGESSIGPIFEPVFGHAKFAHSSAVWYSEKCLSLCHLGEDNFCSATQSCIMKGFFDKQSAGACTNQTCLAGQICGKVDMDIMKNCSVVSKQWSDLFMSVLRSNESDTIKKKMAMYGHGMLGCWRTRHAGWSLVDYVSNLGAYFNLVNVDSTVTGLFAMFNKVTQQSLIWEWILALVKAKCDRSTKLALSTSKQQTIVCGSGARGGMVVDGNAPDEKICFLQGQNKVANCTSDCSFSELSTCLNAMLDDKHSCRKGSACCTEEMGSEEFADDELDMGILDLAEPPELVDLELNSQYGGGSEC